MEIPNAHYCDMKNVAIYNRQFVSVIKYVFLISSNVVLHSA